LPLHASPLIRCEELGDEVDVATVRDLLEAALGELLQWLEIPIAVLEVAQRHRGREGVRHAVTAYNDDLFGSWKLEVGS